MGGCKEVIAKLSGEGAYGYMKFESGGHRVQRVPETESQGRVHTSACTVMVLPEIPPSKAPEINPADLRIDTFRASGAGGQHINKTDSAIRITHIPTGLVVECQDQRSQHSNRARAMEVLVSRLAKLEEDKRNATLAEQRQSVFSSGDRSDRIRTYNFPQSRVTDHRINLTLYRLNEVMEGKLQSDLTTSYRRVPSRAACSYGSARRSLAALLQLLKVVDASPKKPCSYGQGFFISLLPIVFAAVHLLVFPVPAYFSSLLLQCICSSFLCLPISYRFSCTLCLQLSGNAIL